MREKLSPWLPAIFCASLSAITVIGNLVAYNVTGNANATSVVFYCFLPMSFFFVGSYLSRLEKENRTLRSQIGRLISAQHDGTTTA